MISPHKPVLLNEVVETFSDIDSGYIIDATAGYGGHSEALLKQNPHIKLICNDQDSEAFEFLQKRLKKYEDRVILSKNSFSKVVGLYSNYEIRGILADIGVSSLQLDKKDRGFSFESENLDMRMNQENNLSAYEVVNNYSFEALCNIFKDYGEIREYKKVADAIVKKRAKKPIESAKELAEIVKKCSLKGSKKIHPATLVFQAIRIEVNDEIGELVRLLESIKNSNLKECRVAIISFHSLEDKIVKRTFILWQQECICPPGFMRCECGGNNAIGKIVTKKPIPASKEELEANPRSRSAKLRIFQIKR